MTGTFSMRNIERNRIMRLIIRIFALTALLIACDCVAQQGSTSPLFTSDWLIRGGIQRSEADVRLGLGNEELGTIPIVDLDRLDLDPRFTSGWLDITWQAPERWSWGFNYFESRAEGENVTDEDLQFGDLLIPAGTGVLSEFETKFYVLNGYYDFYQAPNRSAGLGFGIYSLDLAASLQEVIAGEPGGIVQGADVLAPLPTLSIYYKQAFNDKWSFTADFNYFGLSVDKYDGNIFSGRVAFDYWLNENWGLGLGLNYVDIDLTIEDDPFDQLYDVQYDSYFLYLSFGF